MEKRLCLRLIESYVFVMFALIRLIVVVLIAFIVAPVSSYAAGPALEGIVKDANGRPLQDAEIRIAGKEGSGIVKVVKTDGNGHYIYRGLGPGTWQVSLIVNSQVKASIANVLMDTGTEQLNFELKAGPAKPYGKGKHFVWVPSQTGSNLAGSWVEIGSEPKQAPLGMRQRADSSGQEMVRQLQQNSDAIRN